MSKKITQEKVEKALDSLALHLDEENVVKASEDDLDQPEGADLGNPAKEKMSDSAKSKKAMKGDLKIMHEDDDDSDEDEMDKKCKSDDGDEDDMKGKGMKKSSFADQLPEEVEAKIEVSDFLKSLVGHTGSAIDALAEYVAKSEEGHTERYEELSGAVNEIQKSQAKIGVVLKAICERIGVIEAAPARVAKSEQVVAKSLEGRQFSAVTENPAAETDAKPLFKSLSSNPLMAKSQISNALCEMVKKGEADAMDVIGFESGGQLRPEIVTKLQAVL